MSPHLVRVASMLLAAQLLSIGTSRSDFTHLHPKMRTTFARRNRRSRGVLSRSESCPPAPRSTTSPLSRGRTRRAMLGTRAPALGAPAVAALACVEPSAVMELATKRGGATDPGWLNASDRSGLNDDGG